MFLFRALAARSSSSYRKRGLVAIEKKRPGDLIGGGALLLRRRGAVWYPDRC